MLYSAAIWESQINEIKRPLNIEFCLLCEDFPVLQIVKTVPFPSKSISCRSFFNYEVDSSHWKDMFLIHRPQKYYTQLKNDQTSRY